MTTATLEQRDAIRRRQTGYMRQRRAMNRLVEIPACKNRKQRERLEGDIFAWLAYFGYLEFTRPFTAQQRDMIAAFQTALTGGGDQAVAASRGEGKTSIAEWVLMYCVLRGLVRFAVLFAATGSDAEQSLASIKERFEENDRLLDLYPEVAAPIQALENTPNRAHYQQVSGKRHDTRKTFEAVPSKFSWSGRELTLPKVPGSPSAGAIIATRGLDAAVRGMKRGSQRPELAIIDDPDTEESVNSADQAAKLEKRIDRNIAGLSGQKRRIARVMLTTVQRRDTVSHRYTDPTVKPSWHGRRYRFLIDKPERSDLWEEYVSLRQADYQTGTNEAHEFYVARREAMDRGATVANEYRRGDSGELSALQFYFNEVARIGAEAVASEYDNDPPEESGPIESGITARRIQQQTSGYDRRELPPGIVCITQGVDVRKVGLHWVVRAWQNDGSGFTIDYGITETIGTQYGSDEGVDVAIKRAILQRAEETKAYPFAVDLTLIDAGWRTDAVYSAVAEAGLGFMPVQGFGKSSGCTSANFSDVQRKTQDRKPGDGWFFSRKGKLWLVCADADRWKAFEHDRWMTAPGMPGSMRIFGAINENPRRMSDDEKAHHAYARHITNEVEVEEPYQGTIRRRWKAKSENTHWLDASYYSDVAANIKGVRVMPDGRQAKASKAPTGSARPTLAELARR